MKNFFERVKFNEFSYAVSLVCTDHDMGIQKLVLRYEFYCYVPIELMVSEIPLNFLGRIASGLS